MEKFYEKLYAYIRPMSPKRQQAAIAWLEYLMGQRAKPECPLSVQQGIAKAVRGIAKAERSIK